MHHLSGTEIAVMVLCIVASLAAMEAVIFVFGARSYKGHGAGRKPGEAQGGTHARDHDSASLPRDRMTSRMKLLRHLTRPAASHSRSNHMG